MLNMMMNMANNMVWMSNALMSAVVAAGLIAGGAGVKHVCRKMLRALGAE
jgi:hypothetical protein